MSHTENANWLSIRLTMLAIVWNLRFCKILTLHLWLAEILWSFWHSQTHDWKRHLWSYICLQLHLPWYPETKWIFKKMFECNTLLQIVTTSVSPINGESPDSLLAMKKKLGTKLNLSDGNLQNIANNPNRPHVREISYCFEVYNFWSHKFRSSEQNLQFFIRIITSGHSKVNDLNPITSFCQT